ncbi:MAG: CAP domain-containing protein [Lautropia sp.]|nr:CAP domain-containing protein [Lautropia sp.]
MQGIKTGGHGISLILASGLLGAVGACGGGGGAEMGLEPALGQGNAAQVRAEYLALGLPLVSGDAGVTKEAAAESAAPVPSQAPLRQDQVNAGLVTPSGQPGQGERAYHRLAQQVVAAVNAARAEARTCGTLPMPAAGPLRWNPQVAYAALLESEWMRRTNQFSHGWEDGKYVWNRFEMVQYNWAQADENIAAGFRTLDEAMRAWIASPSHCKALMRADIREVGLAVIPGGSGSQYASYWTMALGTSR